MTPSTSRPASSSSPKTTGDAILLTQQTVDALESGLPGLTDRGSHALKGKSTAVQVFGLDPAVGVTARTW